MAMRGLRLPWFLATLLGLCCHISLSQPTTRPSQPEPINMRDVMWQVLPEGARSVYVGPDGRVWCELRQGSGPSPSRLARRYVERTFAGPSPQFYGGDIALFEPGGRVWFITDRGKTLLGYNGRDWVEWTAPEGCSLVGNCPGHGRRHELNGFNLYVADHAFFVTSKGVYVHDGQRGSFQDMVQAEGEASHNITISLHAFPQTGEVIALVRRPKPCFWRWRAGEWTTVPTGMEQAYILAPWPEDRVWISAPTGVQLQVIGEGPETRFARLFQQLKSATDEKAREQIAGQMVACGEPVRRLVEESLSNTYDQGVLRHLVRVLEQLKTQGHLVLLGDYRLAGARWLHGDEATGRVYLASRSVFRSQKPLGEGLVIADPGGEVRFVRIPELVERWHSGEAGLLAVPMCDGLWLPGRHSEKYVQYLDLARGAFTHTLPDRRMNWPLAVLPDGTLFVSRGNPATTVEGPVMVFKPGAPDDRKPVPTQQVPLHRDSQGAFCVASDGTIWASVEDKGIVRFDGRAWKTVPGTAGAWSTPLLLPGREGAVLLGVGGFLLATPAGTAQGSDLKTMIREHREVFARQFPSQFAKTAWNTAFAISTDSAGNIWWLDGDRLNVLVGDRWLGATEALREAGSPRGTVEYLSAVGDGSKMYVSDLNSDQNRGRSFLGRVEDGRLLFERAPHAPVGLEMDLGVRDHRGRLWIPGGRDFGSGQTAHCVNERGVVSEVTGAGWPVLCDEDDNIWLRHGRGQGNQFSIWREGKVAGQVTIPPMDERVYLLADRPGSVYACTPTVLYHLRRVEGGSRAQFALAGVFAPDKPIGHPKSMAISRLGYIVISAYSDWQGRRYGLFVIPLPGAVSDAGSKPAE